VAMLTIADLYVQFESGLSRYAGSLARDTDKANDLVSETFLRAIARLGLNEGELVDSSQKQEPGEPFGNRIGNVNYLTL